MEKFTQWEDKSCGINPFVPARRSGVSWVRAVPQGIVACVRLVVACPLFLALVLVAAVAQAFGMVLPPLRLVIHAVLCRPIARILVLDFGVFSISEGIPDHVSIYPKKRKERKPPTSV